MTHQVKPITDYLPEYNDKHRLIIHAIEMQPPGTPIEVLKQMYDIEMGKLKNQFAVIRKAEYESKSAELSRAHSCTSKSPGGKKNCGWKCIAAPHPGMFTQKAWLRVVGKDKGLSVSQAGGQACIKMTVSGKGKNKGTLYATFRYRPEFILAAVEKDTIDLFNLIISSGNMANLTKGLFAKAEDEEENDMYFDERVGESVVYDEDSDDNS